MNYETEFKRYLQGKDLSESTQSTYFRNVGLFFTWIQTDAIKIAKVDVLDYLEYLKKRKRQQNATRELHLFSINHYFKFLVEKEEITDNPCLLLKIRGTKTKTLYKTFSLERLEQLYDNYYQHFVENYDDSHIKAHNRHHAKISRERNAAILSLLIHQGTTTRELDTLLIEDLDLIKAKVKIRAGKKSDERTLALKAEQIGLFTHYLQNIRPKLVEYSTIESSKLFLPLPAYGSKSTDKENLMHIFRLLTKQVKSIDPSFLNFKQIRASVITYWLKTVGLRKAQYLAGHRYISSTENYLPNNLEGLTNDISKLHPYA